MKKTLKRAIDESLLSKAVMFRHLGISKQFFFQILRGERPLPEKHRLKLEELLKCYIVPQKRKKE
jgi:hypothetical protein